MISKVIPWIVNWYCTRDGGCGRENPDSYGFCNGCGKRRP